jgi:hypothetical protein
MSIKGKKFTDDGWAIWLDGDDTLKRKNGNWLDNRFVLWYNY